MHQCNKILALWNIEGELVSLFSEYCTQPIICGIDAITDNY